MNFRRCDLGSGNELRPQVLPPYRRNKKKHSRQGTNSNCISSPPNYYLLCAWNAKGQGMRVTVTRNHPNCICLLMNWFVFWTLKLMYDICWLLGVFRVRWAVLLSWPTRAVGPWECTAKWQMGTPPITTTTIFPRPPQSQAQLHQPKGSRHVDSGRSAPSRFAFLPQSFVRVTLVCYLVQFLYEGQFQRYTHKNIGYEKSKLGKLRSVSIYHCVCILSSRTTWCLC